MADPIDDLSAQIDQLTREKFDELLARIRDGENPRDVIDSIQTSWTGQYADMLRSAFSAALLESVGKAELRALPIGNVTFSESLYVHAADTSAIARGIIADHAKGFQQARELALQLYSGFNFQLDPLTVKKALPKYLMQLMKEPAVDRPLRGLLTRIQATQIKTPTLRAAYLQAIDAIMADAGQAALAKKLKVAWFFRNRYFAQRIAVTELHRAYEDQKARDFLADGQLHWVQWRKSSNHPHMDVCDYFAGVDKWGMGAGIYPLEEAPRPPVHPHCRCLLIQRYDLGDIQRRERVGSDRAWLRNQSAEDGARIMGSYDKRKEFLGGADFESIFNAGKPEAYRLQKVGDLK